MADTLFPERTAWPEMDIKKSIQKMERPKLKHFYFYLSIFLSYLILSYPIPPLLSYPIPSYPILSYPIIYLSIYLCRTSMDIPPQKPLRMWPCLLSPAMKNRNMPPHAVCKLKRRIKSINHCQPQQINRKWTFPCPRQLDATCAPDIP